MYGVEPLSVLFAAHCPLAWWDVVAVLGPFSVRNEFYPWELGVAILIAGVGLFQLHQATCDSVSDVYTQIVFGILELVDEILRVVFIAYDWYRFAGCGIGAFTACVWAEVTRAIQDSLDLDSSCQCLVALYLPQGTCHP